MYEYSYVSISGDGFFGGGGFSKHREIIDQHAADGWRYVGFVPIDIAGEGGIRMVDLIFERVKLEGV